MLTNEEHIGNLLEAIDLQKDSVNFDIFSRLENATILRDLEEVLELLNKNVAIQFSKKSTP